MKRIVLHPLPVLCMNERVKASLTTTPSPHNRRHVHISSTADMAVHIKSNLGLQSFVFNFTYITVYCRAT